VWAAELGLPYAFADFINAAGAPIAQDYRQRFQPSVRLEDPQVAAAVWAIAADTDEEALRLGASAKMSFTLLRRGQLVPVPPVETAVAFLEREGIPLDKVGQGRRTILGTPDRVRAAIEQVTRDYGAEEAIVVTITHDHAARRRSYELIAEAFGLERGAPAASAASSATVMT